MDDVSELDHAWVEWLEERVAELERLLDTIKSARASASTAITPKDRTPRTTCSCARTRGHTGHKHWTRRGVAIGRQPGGAISPSAEPASPEPQVVENKSYD